MSNLRDKIDANILILWYNIENLRRCGMSVVESVCKNMDTFDIEGLRDVYAHVLMLLKEKDTIQYVSAKNIDRVNALNKITGICNEEGLSLDDYRELRIKEKFA